MTSASDEKWRPFNCFFSRVVLRTYQHPCSVVCRITCLLSNPCFLFIFSTLFLILLFATVAAYSFDLSLFPLSLFFIVIVIIISI